MCPQGRDMNVKLSSFHPAFGTVRMGREGWGAEEGEHPSRAQLQADTFL